MIRGFTAPGCAKIFLSLRLTPKLNPCGAQISKGQNKSASKIAVTQWKQNRVSLDLFLPDGDAISAAIALGLLNGLVYHQGLLFHGSCLYGNREAYIFLGRSGAGKSTIASQATGFSCAHQDRVAVRKTERGWMAYGVPLRDNDGSAGRNVEKKLARIFLIRKSVKARLIDIQSSPAVSMTDQHVFMPLNNPEAIKKTAESLFCLASEVPFSILYFPRNFDFGKWWYEQKS
jgi:hypothetical protein